MYEMSQSVREVPGEGGTDGEKGNSKHGGNKKYPLGLLLSLNQVGSPRGGFSGLAIR